MGHIKEKMLTKHVCQLGKSLAYKTGILPGFRLLFTSLHMTTFICCIRVDVMFGLLDCVHYLQ